MLGAIFGDIVGSIYERHNVKRTDFQLITRYSHPTDDSIMTLAVAKALMETWDIWSDTSVLSSDRDLAVVKALTANMQSMGRMYPNAGYGGAFRRWVRSNDPQPYGSWGNGSAMRVSPVGWLCNTLDDVLRLAALTASVTHNSAEGIKGAQAIASCVFMARSGMSKSDMRQVCLDLFGYNLSRTLDEIRPDYTFDVSCQGSVPEAIIAFMESDSYEDAIRLAVSLGGDSDTIACMAGAIAEAYYGMPQNFREQALSILDSYCVKIVNTFHDFCHAR